MNHPKKWRETCDPFALPFRSFRLLAVLGYPHAGNDVFHVEGIFRGKRLRAYLKVERQKGAAVGNEAAILRQIRHPAIPEVLEAGERYCLTREKPGERLSTLLGDNVGLPSMAYLREYGRTLAWIHRQRPDAPPVADRKFFHRPSKELLNQLGLSHLEGFFQEEPKAEQICFCHGDFHYANLLWQGGHLSAILDLELAGYGDRDFDIAWALLPRSGQRFLKTPEEQRLFLEGYEELGTCSHAAIAFHMAKAAVYFLNICQDDPIYCTYLRKWLDKPWEV